MFIVYSRLSTEEDKLAKMNKDNVYYFIIIGSWCEADFLDTHEHHVMFYRNPEPICFE